MTSRRHPIDRPASFSLPPFIVEHRYALLSALIAGAVYQAFREFRRRLLARARPPHLSMAPHVDLALVFRGSTNSLLKGALREDSQHAEEQYSRLLQTLKGAGLHATGRRGEKQGQLLVLIACPQTTLTTLVQRERLVLNALDAYQIAYTIADTLTSSMACLPATLHPLRTSPRAKGSPQQTASVPYTPTLPPCHRMEVLALYLAPKNGRV
jgi:hypothetical protein